MNRRPSRAFRRWCAGLILLVFTWSLPGSVEARVSPIELVKFQLKKPNFLIVVESAESMQGLPGENAARYNEVGVDCEKGDRFCRLYGQQGRCEFSGMGAQGYVFDEVPMGTNTTTSTSTRTGGIKVITQTDSRVETNFTTEVATSTGANSNSQTEISTETGTQTSIGTQTAYQTSTSFETETYHQTANQTATQTSNTTGTLTGTETYNKTSTITGTETYNTTSTITGTETYNTTSTITGTETYNTTGTITGTETYRTTDTRWATASVTAMKIGTDANIVGYWPLNGNHFDYSGNMRNGSLVGSPAAVNPSKVGSAYKYASGQYFTVGGVPTPGAAGAGVTIATWLRGDVINQTEVFAEYASFGGNNGLRLYLNNSTGKLIFDNNTSTPGGAQVTNPLNGIWWLLVAVLSTDKKTWNLYYLDDPTNGGNCTASSHKTSYTAGSAANIVDGGSWCFGAGCSTSSGATPLDEVRVWDRALTEAEIGSLCSCNYVSCAAPTGTSSWTVTSTPNTVYTTTNTALRTVNTTNTGTTTNTDSRTVATTNTGTTTNTDSRTVTTTNTGTTTNIDSRTVTTTNTGTTTDTDSRTVTTTNTGTTTNTVSQSITTTDTGTTTNTATRVGSSTRSDSNTSTMSVTQVQTQIATVTTTAIPETVVLTNIANTTITENRTATFTETATVTSTYAVHPIPDTDDCDVLVGCGGPSYCYLQSTKACSRNSDCPTSGDFCRRIDPLQDGTNRIRPNTCVASNPTNKICRYQTKSCTDDPDCWGSTTGLDYCVTGAPAQMCQKTGLWCGVSDTGGQCSGSDDKCIPATSRMMMVKNAVRRVFLEHAYDDNAVVKIGQMHTYQANGQGSTDNLFPYVKLSEPTVDQTEIRFLPRDELLRGTAPDGKACFVESTGPSSTCTIDYGGGSATTTPSVVYSLVSPANDSRYAIPTGDGKTFAHADDKWATCGLSCSFPSASTAGTGSYEGSYYAFTYRRGVPIDEGADPNNPTVGSVKNPQYYSTYKGKSFGSSGNYWMLMDAERSDMVSENKYGARDFLGKTWSSGAEYSLPYSGASGDPLSTSVACSASNGAQWDHNLVPMVNATTFGGQSLTPPEKALLNVARLEKNSFGGFHAVGNIAPVACALKNDSANDSYHSVEGYMSAVKAADGSACWQNHVLLVVDGLPRGPGDVAVGGIDCSAPACKYDSNPSLSGCNCPAVEKARSLAASGINVHVIAATTNPTAVNLYAAHTLNNIAIAGSTSASFINQPRYAASEDELHFWLNYEMKEALRVRVATTPAAAANGSQSLSGITAGNMLYQTVAELPEWRGSLVGYQIGTVSVTSTSTSTATGTGTGTEVAYTTTKKWDAALRNGWVPCLATQAGCNVPNDFRWKSRNVFFSDAAGVVRRLEIQSSDETIKGDSQSALLALGLGANAEETLRIVKWMLGKLDTSDTANPRPINPAVMGSVVNSMPISVGPPGMSTLLGGNHFYYTHNTRPELVYVGSDDGMLHAFYASDGEEAFAFIPADMVPVIAKLYAQGGQRYNPSEHIYGLSGSPKVKNLCVENCNPTTPSLCSDENGGSYADGSCPVWKTVLIMGEGQGGNHPFALDITDPIVSGEPNITSSKLLWHVGHKNASSIPASELGDTMSVPAFAYKKTTDQLDQRVLMASSYPASGHSYTKLIDAKLVDGGLSGGAGMEMYGAGCTQDFGMVADVALARDYTKDGAQSLIAAYLADTHGTVHQYAPAFSSAPGTVMSLGCNHPLHFSPAVVQLNRNDPNNINGTSVFLAQVTNSLLDSATRGSTTPSKLVVKKLTAIGNYPPAADASFGISGEIHLSAGTSCSGTNCLCGVAETIKTSTTSGCGSGGSTIPDEARPTGTPVAVIRTDGAGFQLYTTWYKPPASNWDNCQTSDSNGTSYITLHEFLSNGTWAQIAGITIPHQYVTGVQFVGTTLFVTYGVQEQGAGAPAGLPNLGQTFVSVDQVLKSVSSDRFVRTAWAERLDL